MCTRMDTFFDGACSAGLGWLWTENLRAYWTPRLVFFISYRDKSNSEWKCDVGQLTLASSSCVSSKVPESEAFTSR